jgi:hypothetical protein
MLQVETLYKEIQEIKHRDYVIQASFHGVQIDDSKSSSTGTTHRKAVEDPKVPIFRDPEEYKTMSEEDRNAETERMMGLHKRWSGDAINKVPVM